jgi:hypothetical protein
MLYARSVRRRILLPFVARKASIGADMDANPEGVIVTHDAPPIDASIPPASWSAPTLAEELSSTASSTSNEADPWISPDGRTMLFTCNRDGTQRIWQATR